LVLPLIGVGILAARLVYGPSWGTLVELGAIAPAHVGDTFNWIGAAYLAMFAGCVAVVALVPATGRPLARLVTRWRVRPSIGGGRLGGAAAAAVTLAYLFATARAQHRVTWPVIHDEFSYLIQAHQLAAGHLCYPQHPLADFFDSFQLFVRPVYASAYFPGTALLYVPGVWFHIDPWITSLIVAAGVAGALWHAVARAVDGLSASLAVLLLWCDDYYRNASMGVGGQLPLMLFGLLAVACWQHCRSDRQRRWWVAVGLFIGLAAVTRPVDAICFAAPLAVAQIWATRQRPRALVRQGLAVMVGLLPSLAVQLALNHQITGRWLETPFRLYADRDYPGTAYGFHPLSAEARPASALPQKQKLFDQYLPLIREHTWANVWSTLVRGSRARGWPVPGRLPTTLSLASPVPFVLLTPLFPLAVLGLNRRVLVLLSVGPLFLLLYVPYAFFLSNYTLTAAVTVVTAIAMGTRALDRLPLPTRWTHGGPVFGTGLVFGIAVAALPQWSQGTSDDLVHSPVVAAARAVDAQVGAAGPAVVLYTYDPARSPHDEPVFNADVGWPDDARVIRAHDLGPDRDRALFRYYADRQPTRTIYRYDERTGNLSRLGTAADVARRTDHPNP
jgi:hypothetical protein